MGKSLQGNPENSEGRRAPTKTQDSNMFGHRRQQTSRRGAIIRYNIFQLSVPGQSFRLFVVNQTIVSSLQQSP